MLTGKKDYSFTTKTSESPMMVTESTSADGFVKSQRRNKEGAYMIQFKRGDTEEIWDSTPFEVPERQPGQQAQP